MMQKQPWIGKSLTDIIFILSPPFLSLLVIILFPSLFGEHQEISIAGWVILILLIDVAHVYSTLYRTYFDPAALSRQRYLLWIIPFAGFVAGVLLYSVSSAWFWRILAYVAVFHFVRQQYGFMRVYSRKENKKGLPALIDTITIYYATIYPLVYWHLSGPRKFHWFVEKDFFYIQANWLLVSASILYIIVLAAWLIKEGWSIFRYRYINIPKTAIITGTILSWYFGIVYFNGDLTFTLLNVVSHGIPYIALIWIYGKKNYTKPGKGSRFLKLAFGRFGLIIFLLPLFAFAFVEEGLWDLTLWNEHQSVFGLQHFAQLSLSDQLLSFVIPLLALPQITHYILDGFIWKIRQDEFKWNNEVKT